MERLYAVKSTVWKGREELRIYSLVYAESEADAKTQVYGYSVSKEADEINIENISEVTLKKPYERLASFKFASARFPEVDFVSLVLVAESLMHGVPLLKFDFRWLAEMFPRYGLYAAFAVMQEDGLGQFDGRDTFYFGKWWKELYAQYIDYINKE